MKARYSYPLAIVCGIAMSLPFTDVSMWPAWCGLAPMFYLVAEAPTHKRAAGLAYVFALVWALLCNRFFNHWSMAGWIALGLFTALFYMAALLAVRVLARRGLVGGVLGAAAAWVLAEMARACIPVVGYPWMLLGHATVNDPNLRQLAELFGVYGLSFLVAAVNAALAFVLAPFLVGRLSGPPGPPARRRLCGALVAVLFLAALAYGDARVQMLGARMRGGPRIALIQGCSYQKIERSDEEKQKQLDEHLAMHEQAAAAGPMKQRPDLICWAETMVPGIFNIETYAIKFTGTVRRCGIPTVFGSDWVHPDDKNLEQIDQRWFNSAFVMNADGTVQGRYAKQRLVPFGEYIPFTQTLPFMLALRSVTRDSYRPGEARSPVFQAAGIRFAFNICVEDIFPDLARQSARDGAEALINVTNDGWFHETFGPAAHLQAGRLRAVEVRRPLVRVTNSGVSAVVDPLGNLSVPIEPDQVGVGYAQVHMLQEPPRQTWYMQIGDLGVAVFLVTILLLGFYLDGLYKSQDVLDA